MRKFTGVFRTKCDKVECCVVCGRETKISWEIPVQTRPHYVQGVGQLCDRCWKEVYGEA